MMYIHGKGRKDHVVGIANIPSTENATHKMWKAKDDMFKSWLINSMANEINESFLLYFTTREIWDGARETSLT